jgi:hypothetical protein
MSEWNTDAYSRKWEKSWCRYTLDGEERFGRIYNIQGLQEWTIGYLKGMDDPVFLDKGDGSLKTIALHYFNFPSGIYPNKNGTFSVVTRAHRKRFYVGLREDHTHYINTDYGAFDPDGALVDPKGEFTGASAGFFNRLLWWANEKLYIIKSHVGFIHDERKIIVDDEAYVPFVQQMVGGKCLVRAL